MTATLDPRLQRVFVAAAGLAGADRERAVREGCAGDAALEAEVRSLLLAHDGAGDFLQRPPAEPPPPPELIAGRYRLAGAIGSGSMGTVYRAEQLEPVRRTVALKLLRHGASSAESLQRFEVERRIVARLTHAGIARLLDSGTTADGRPWFAMEHVEGRALTTWCDERGLSFAARVRLVVDVCRAAHHAHGNGVIHRDLKPGNVLVCEQDGRPVPRIIDFGVAKASAALGVAPFQTLHGELVGTLEYMSPEQALGAPGGVDARTDVYALGAILFELLTGEPPLPVAAARREGLDSVLRVLREAEPRRPSAVLLARAREAEPARRAELRASARRTRGDLDRIVLTAVEKDRARRYASAAELADDLERFLRHEPVSVSEPTALYQLGKFARRHRAAVAGAAGVLLALLVGLVLALREARESERLRGLAVDREVEAGQVALAALRFATGMVGVANDELSNLAGGTSARLEVARRAFEQVQAFADRPAVRAEVDTALGYARQRVGEAETVAGRPDAALSWYEGALVDRERAVQGLGGTFERRTVGVSHWRLCEARLALGELPAAEGHARTALATMLALEAEGALATPIEHGAYLGMSRQHLGEVLALQGRDDEALRELDEALAVLDAALQGAPAHVPLHRTRAQVLRGRGELLARAGRLDEALAALEAALASLREQARLAGPANVWERAQTTLALLGRGDVAAARGRLPDALQDAGIAVELSRALAEVDPDDFESGVLLGRASSELGGRLAELGCRDEAVTALVEAAALLERLARQAPRHALARREQARACARVAAVLGDAGGGPELDWPRRTRELVQDLQRDGLLLPVDGDLLAWLGGDGATAVR